MDSSLQFSRSCKSVTWVFSFPKTFLASSIPWADNFVSDEASLRFVLYLIGVLLFTADRLTLSRSTIMLSYLSIFCSSTVLISSTCPFSCSSSSCCCMFSCSSLSFSPRKFSISSLYFLSSGRSSALRDPLTFTSLRIGLFFILFARAANFSVFIDSEKCCAAGVMVQMIAVLEFPPSAGSRILVSLLSLYGMWPLAVMSL
mmetsp:Transcript_21365/g.48276  ORF Transcript_21365/g.48276 Transcript_21365/m.48276 type:complete len:201 (+) Transcript_21365:1588-2190(+)